MPGLEMGSSLELFRTRTARTAQEASREIQVAVNQGAFAGLGSHRGLGELELKV